MKITGRTSSITNAFVNSIIPSIPPSQDDVDAALAILGMSANEVRCAYCGDPSTEWDHLRPLVSDKRPTGFVSEIGNLVPSCGKCNQSKGNKEWSIWITSAARLSPKTRGVPNLDGRIARLRAYERWRPKTPVDFEAMVPKELWDQHWQNREKLVAAMRESQVLADRIREHVERIGAT
jgi:hypothetical protein